jgi:hypothetical protein
MEVMRLSDFLYQVGKDIPLKGRALGSNARFAAFLRLLPLIPPAPFSHTERRGRLGVLMPETEDGMQGFPKNLPL